MRRWLIADTHIAHAGIIRHCRRPADSDDRIIKAWQQLVRPEDIVIHLGDFAFNCVKLDTLLAQLPGRKILVLGNHDSKSVSAYMNAGFSFVVDSFTWGRYYFTHRPSESLAPGTEINIHGHLHNNVPKGYRRWPHCRLFSLEYEDCRPCILEKFLAKEAKLNATLVK